MLYAPRVAPAYHYASRRPAASRGLPARFSFDTHYYIFMRKHGRCLSAMFNEKYLFYFISTKLLNFKGNNGDKIAGAAARRLDFPDFTHSAFIYDGGYHTISHDVATYDACASPLLSMRADEIADGYRLHSRQSEEVLISSQCRRFHFACAYARWSIFCRSLVRPLL